MKKLLLILLCLPLLFSSCTNHYKDGEMLFNKGINEESQDILNDANLALDMIKETHKNYKKSGVLKHKIDSVISRWDSIYQAKEVADSLWYISYKAKLESEKIAAEENRVIEEKKLVAANEAARNAELKKFPNLVGKWRCYNTNYLSGLNSIIRIYKKDGIYYQNMHYDKDGSQGDFKLIKKSSKRFDVVGKSDYNIINKDGDLEFWDKEGYFLTCKKIKEVKEKKQIKERKQIKSLETLLKDAIGSNVFNYRYDNNLGNPTTLEGTNNTYWISYYVDVDITLISLKKTDIILNSSKGKVPHLSID